MVARKQTRESILDQAVERASVVGLVALSIGDLAAHTGLTKAGLFRYFGSKEALQVATLEHGVARFTAHVVRPALQEPRGLPRVTALFDRWLDWTAGGGPKGGCLFVTAFVEFDDRRVGPVRDYLVRTQREWLELLARTAALAVEAGAFRPDLDGGQFAHEFNSILLGYHQAARLLREPRAGERAKAAFERLLEDAARAPVA